jgi:hypothetical protein
MNNDQLILEDLYTQMYDENWKNKLLGGAAALGLGAAGTQMAANHIVDQDNAVKNHVDPSGAKLQNIELTNTFKDTAKLQMAIQQYFKQQGKPVSVTVNGDNVTISSPKGTKNVSMKTLKTAVDTAKSNGDTTQLAGYLAQHL